MRAHTKSARDVHVTYHVVLSMRNAHGTRKVLSEALKKMKVGLFAATLCGWCSNNLN